MNVRGLWKFLSLALELEYQTFWHTRSSVTSTQLISRHLASSPSQIYDLDIFSFALKPLQYLVLSSRLNINQRLHTCPPLAFKKYNALDVAASLFTMDM